MTIEDTTHYAERVIIVETKLEGMREQAKAHITETRAELKEINDKIDRLSDMLNRGRGMGAVLAVLGAGVVSGVVYLLTRIIHIN